MPVHSMNRKYWAFSTLINYKFYLLGRRIRMGFKIPMLQWKLMFCKTNDSIRI